MLSLKTFPRHCQGVSVSSETKVDTLVQLLQKTGALKHGHFRLTSGRHSDTYVQCAQLMKNPQTTIKLARTAVENIPKEIRKAITLVASPAIGGITWGFSVAYVLGVDFVFAERKNGKMSLRRGFHAQPDDSVLICEDVVTTGGSVKEVIEVLHKEKTHVAGVVSIIDRKSARVFTDPFWPLLKLKIESWQPENCALCMKGIEIEAPGSRNLKKNRKKIKKCLKI